MTPEGEGGPPERPDYKVYRSRRWPSLSKPSLAGLREKLPGRGERERRPRPALEPERERRPWLRWIGLALLGWLLLSVLAFGVSAQIQKAKLADMRGTLGGNPLLAAFPQNILVLGTDVRSSEFASDAETESEQCVEAAASGEPPPSGCGPSRADTIMVLRAGGGAFEKLSIPRDTFAAIPGQGSQKINAAYAFGGAALQVETVEQFLGIEINHVAIVDFGGFVDFIDAIGGVDVKMPQHVCNTISGTFKIDLRGEEHLNGDKALALARTRSSSCGEPIDDTDRAAFQQLVLRGIKDRLTSPTRIPRNFLFGPWIGWNAPKALVSDMGALTFPQLVLAAAIGGDSKDSVLEPSAPGPSGSLFVPAENCAKAVRRLTGSAPDEAPACSPAA